MVNTIGNTVAEDYWVIKSRIKLKVAEYEAQQGRKVEYKEMAEKVGVTQQQFSAWVNDRGWPRVDKLFG